ncbi:MAG: hypothetical protein A2287_02440 [Candidatus Melainabacteria bacterium RIFOXYA12_FULL_32_12]|nr:MAG: hypothetical protein A2287_02440 [Candidatus Melainabacteria bacterium RIFOXYA12_FULL_32_12]
MLKQIFKKIIEKLELINLEFEKIFASKVLGRKYLRRGKCKTCGRCCQKIYIRHRSSIIKDEEEFEKLQSLHFFYSYIKVVGKDDTGLIFECTKLDIEKGLCNAHSRRAMICRQYPQEEIFMMGGIISEDCGYKFIPIRSFEEVFSKVQKKSNNKQVEFTLEPD